MTNAITDIIHTAVSILLIILVIMTAITAPETSLEYGKEVLRSGVKLYQWAKDYVSEVRENKDMYDLGVDENGG